LQIGKISVSEKILKKTLPKNETCLRFSSWPRRLHQLS